MEEVKKLIDALSRELLKTYIYSYSEDRDGRKFDIYVSNSGYISLHRAHTYDEQGRNIYIKDYRINYLANKTQSSDIVFQGRLDPTNADLFNMIKTFLKIGAST